MRKTLWVFVLLVVFGGPAVAESTVAEPDATEPIVTDAVVAESADAKCLAAPTYDCLIAGARAAAESEPDNGERASLLASMAGAQAVAGRREDAAETLKRALACASSIRDDWDREYFAMLVIWAKAWMGEIDEATALAAYIDDSYNSAFAWSSLAEGQAIHGDRKGADRSLRMASVAASQLSETSKGYVGAFLAISHAFAGKPDRAHELALQTREMDEEESGRSWFFYAQAAAAVAEAIAGHDRDSNAFIAGVRPRLAELEEVGDRAGLLSYISWALAEQGDRDAMFAAIGEMASLDLDKATAGDKAYALATAAMALGRAGL